MSTSSRDCGAKSQVWDACERPRRSGAQHLERQSSERILQKRVQEMLWMSTSPRVKRLLHSAASESCLPVAFKIAHVCVDAWDFKSCGYMIPPAASEGSIMTRL